MDDAERMKKIAQLAWEVSPHFRHRFNSAEELEAKLIAGREHMQGILGFFLPVSILETLCTVDSFQNTINHAELDELMGESNVHPDEVARARAMIEHMSPLVPRLKSLCGDWI